MILTRSRTTDSAASSSPLLPRPSTPPHPTSSTSSSGSRGPKFYERVRTILSSTRRARAKSLPTAPAVGKDFTQPIEVFKDPQYSDDDDDDEDTPYKSRNIEVILRTTIFSNLTAPVCKEGEYDSCSFYEVMIRNGWPPPPVPPMAWENDASEH